MQSWIIRFWSLCALFFCCLLVEANAVNLDQCKASFRNETGETQFTYKQCVNTCGGGAGVFKWSMFSQDFNAWVLPWITLMFQLPFGATTRADNLISVLLAVGSPALAGYSLAITTLNTRWLSRELIYHHFPNRVNLARAISALQQIPFKIRTSGSLLPSLIVLPQNERYWKRLGVAARRTRQWSIPVAMHVAWVLVAFVFAVVDSFVDFNHFLAIPGGAVYSIAAAWAYLLPVVIGWLHVGSQPEAHYLRAALDDAHDLAYVATTTEPILATHIGHRITRAIEPSTMHIDHVNHDEGKTAPIFNYARVFIWSQNAEYILQLYSHAAGRAEQRIPVHGGIWEIPGDPIAPKNLIGNEAEVVHYCTPVGGGVPKFDPFSHTKYVPTAHPTKDDEENTEATIPVKSIFATGVFHRIAVAAILALCLQWGTTGASILILILTPPKGIGCHAFTFIIYGSAATISFFLLFFSSILAHWTRPQTAWRRRSLSNTFAGPAAALTRWMGKTIAILNGLGLLITCIMQFGGTFDNCFCSSTIFGGDPDGLIKFVGPDIKKGEVYGSWIGGMVMAFGVGVLYSFAIYLTMSPIESS